MSVTTELVNEGANALDGAFGLLPDVESPYSVSFKTQRGTLVSVRGRTADELADRLGYLSAPMLPPDGGTVLEMIRDIDGALGGQAAATSGGTPFSGGQQQQSLGRRCPECNGEAQFREGDNSRGHWKGYFCAVNRDHKPQFVK